MTDPLRRYLPTTRNQLAEWYDAGEVPATELFFVAPEESDLGEYSALMDAADRSSTLPDGDGRRMVLVIETSRADVPDASGVAGPPDVTAWRFVMALHVDVDAGADHQEELAWYATQEIGSLLAL